MMNDRFRKELDGQLADVSWKLENTKNVMNRVKGQKRRPVRMSAVLIAALVALFALGCVGYAEYGSQLLEQIFRGRSVSQATAALLETDMHSMSKDGITVTVTEYAFDGEVLYIQAEMRNETEDDLLCVLDGPRVNGVSGDVSGRFDILNGGSALVMIQAGETATSSARVDYGRMVVGSSEEYEISIDALALRPLGEVAPDVNDLPMYSTDKYHNTGLTEQVFSETLTFSVPLRDDVEISRGIFGDIRIRMEEYGYTLLVKEAKFTGTTSFVSFEMIPDDPKEIMAYGEEGSDGHERLYRRYEILDESGERLFKGLTGSGDMGWGNTRHTYLRYNFSFEPLSEMPECMILVPMNDGGEYIMEEAVTILLGA